MQEWTKLSVALIAASEDGDSAALSAIERAGARCAQSETFATGELALLQRTTELIVIDALQADEGALCSFLDRVEQYALPVTHRMVAIVRQDQIAIAADLLLRLRAEILCDPSIDDICDALTRLAKRPAYILNDISRDRSRLTELQADLLNLAARLREVTGEPELASEPERPVSPELVRELIQERRMRDRYLDPGLFADPAWDMLLDLYLAHLEGRSVSVSSLCIAAATPPSTALRWLASMTDSGYFVRRPDPTDKRRYLVSLDDRAKSALTRYFEGIQKRRAGTPEVRGPGI